MPDTLTHAPSMHTLQTEAQDSCKARGHVMGPWCQHKPGTSYAHCTRCGMQVVADTDPAPDGIAVTGEAVTLTCTGPGPWHRQDVRHHTEETACDWCGRPAYVGDWVLVLDGGTADACSPGCARQLVHRG